MEEFIKRRKEFHLDKLKQITEKEEKLKQLPFAEYMQVAGECRNQNCYEVLERTFHMWCFWGIPIGYMVHRILYGNLY